MKKILHKVVLFFLSPKKAFKAEEKTKLNEAFKYSLIGLIVLGVLAAFITLALPEAFAEIELPLSVLWLAVFLTTVIIGFIGLVIKGLWFHLWAYLFGARKGVSQTIKVVLYSETPNYYLGWIPVFSIITGIWSLVLAVIGIKQLQKISTTRAIAAVVIAVIIPLVIFVAIVLWILSITAPLIGQAGIPNFNLL